MASIIYCFNRGLIIFALIGPSFLDMQLMQSTGKGKIFSTVLIYSFNDMLCIFFGYEISAFNNHDKTVDVVYSLQDAFNSLVSLR